MSQFKVNVRHPAAPDAPVPEEETTIIVPNTGDSTSNSASVFQPATPVLAVVFIFLTIFALQKLQKSARAPKSRHFHLKPGLKSLLHLILIAVFLSAPVIITKNSQDALTKEASAASESVDLSDNSNSISVTVEDVDLDVEVTDQNVFAMAKSTITVQDSTDFGYNLGVYASGSDLTNAAGDTISSISAAAATLTENAWGIALSEPEDENSPIWNSLPTSSAEALLLKSTGYQYTPAADQTTVYFGVFLTPELPEGNYESPTLNYVAVSNLPPETTLIFDANYDSPDDFILGEQTVTFRSKTTLLSPNLKRQGYGFIGWSEDKTAGEHPEISTIYGPNETIAIDGSYREEIRLYAIWLASSGTLQNWTCPADANFPVGKIVALTDVRDKNTYAVAKLADGRCWMIENLRLGGEAEIALTEENTQTAGLLPESSSGWVVISSSSAKYLNIENQLSANTPVSNNSSANYAYGNYYTWSTAVNYNAATFNTLESSICPAGWGLPGGSAGNFSSLDESLGGSGSNRNNDPAASDNWRAYPNNFVFSGYLSTTIQNRGENGFYWSRPAYDSTSAYRLAFSGNSINFNNAQKGFGGAIRCITLD